MKLYQRIKIVARDCAGSEVKMATAMGMHPRTLNGYLKDSREHNLWPLLPKILEIWDQINRDWLYFGEGEMLLPEGEVEKAVEPASSVVGPPSEREAALERENAQLLRALLASKEDALAKANETIASQSETIAMQKQMLRQAQVAIPFTASADPAQAGDQRIATESPAPGVRTSKPHFERKP